MGKCGAGLSTAASQYPMLGMILVCREPGLAGAIAGRILDPLALRAAFALNGGLCTFALVSTFALFTNLSSVLGTAVLAPAVTGSDSGSLLIDGLAFATESLQDFRGS